MSQKSDDLDVQDAIIPWAEGNGLWRQMNGLTSSLSGVDVATFFALNPHACDSAEELAVRIGHRVADVERVLEQLEMVGILVCADLGAVRIYRLVDDPEFRQVLQQYVIWLKEGYHWARLGMEL